MGQTLIPYYENGKYGYCDIEGNVKITPKYDKVDFFSNDSLTFVTKDNNKVLINKNGYEFLTYPNDVDIQILPVYKQKGNTNRWHGFYAGDTIKHLRWVKFNKTKYQLLNLDALTKSPIYNLSSSNNLRSSRPPQINTFAHGYCIGKISENSYDILNEDGVVISNSQSTPIIWSPESIFIMVNDTQCLYNPSTDYTYQYPYKSIVNVIENKYLIVSTAKQDLDSFVYNWGNTKYGLININSEVILDTLYKSIQFHNGIFILNKNDNSFLSDLNNILVDSTEYKFITPLGDSLFLAKHHDDKVQVLNLSGMTLLNNQKLDAFKFYKHENYYTLRDGETVSILDSTLNEEISFSAESIYRDYLKDDRYFVSKNGMMGMIDARKNIIIPIQYDRCNYSKDNFIILTKDEKKGLAYSNGMIIFEPAYEDIQIEEVNGDTLLRLKRNGLYASYDLTGKQLSDFTSRYSRLSGRPVDWHHHKNSYHFSDFHGSPLNVDSKRFFTGYTEIDSVFIAVLHNRDTINEVIIDGKLFRDWGKNYDSVRKVNIKKGLILVTKNNEQGVIDVNRNIISPFSNQEIIEVNNEFFISKRKGKYFLFDHKGKQINEVGYDYVSDSKIKGRRPVANFIPNKYYEYITNPCLTGRQDTILKPQKEYGYINKYGKVIIPLEYSSTFRYFEDYVFLSKGFVDGEKECYLLDTIGKVILQTKSDRLYPLNHSDSSGYYIAEINGKHGLIDIEGNTVIPFEYSTIQGFFEAKIIKVSDFNDDSHLLSIDNKLIFSGEHYNKNSRKQCYKVAGDKILYFPNEQSEIIDRHGNSILKIESQNLKFITKDHLDLIEVDMGQFKYFINKETLIEYKGAND